MFICHQINAKSPLNSPELWQHFVGRAKSTDGGSVPRADGSALYQRAKLKQCGPSVVHRTINRINLAGSNVWFPST